MNILQHVSVWIALILMTGFWVGINFFSTHHAIEFLRISQATFAVIPFVAFLPYAIQGFRKSWPDRVDQMAMGIACWGLSGILSGVWFLLWRLGDQQPWMLTSRTAAFLIFLNVCGSILLSTAPGALNGRIPRRNLIMLGIACSAAMLLFLSVAYHEQHMPEFIQSLEGYLP